MGVYRSCSVEGLVETGGQLTRQIASVEVIQSRIAGGQCSRAEATPHLDQRSADSVDITRWCTES
ncbi:uncharacterized protein METZ01_LOCUS443002, partial [marine metagenome]